ncbi:B3 domain-containing protein Os01g0234100-like isoform X2 [Malania oleifera]|nr:B3 domain-containing protein Os01g0234100-like isoform X2 [Malania oleifera]
MHRRKRQKYKHLKARTSVMKRAEELQANLETEFPSFIRVMLQSFVARGFWMGIPQKFCHLHMPKHDSVVVVVDESGEEYNITYLADKRGLSGGWRGFSLAHNLLVGDVLVFQLVRPTEFKVYIVRRNGLAEMDGTLCLLNLDASTDGSSSDAQENLNINTQNEEYSLEPQSPEIPQEDIQKNAPVESPAPKMIPQEDIQKHNPVESRSPEFAREDTQNNTPVAPDVDVEPPAETHQPERAVRIMTQESEVLGGLKSPGPVLDFNEVKCIEHFVVLVNGLEIGSKLTGHTLTNYYELCRTRRSFLHDRLLRNISCQLAATIISETVNISNAIRSCELSTSWADYMSWRKTLLSFEMLGMNVGFMRFRVKKLVNLAFESEGAAQTRRHKEVQVARASVGEKIRSLELKLLELRGEAERLEAENEILEKNCKKHELVFLEEANAPWCDD